MHGIKVGFVKNQGDIEKITIRPANYSTEENEVSVYIAALLKERGLHVLSQKDASQYSVGKGQVVVSARGVFHNKILYGEGKYIVDFEGGDCKDFSKILKEFPGIASKRGFKTHQSRAFGISTEITFLKPVS